MWDFGDKFNKAFVAVHLVPLKRFMRHDNSQLFPLADFYLLTDNLQFFWPLSILYLWEHITEYLGLVMLDDSKQEK